MVLISLWIVALIVSSLVAAGVGGKFGSFRGLQCYVHEWGMLSALSLVLFSVGALVRACVKKQTVQRTHNYLIFLRGYSTSLSFLTSRWPTLCLSLKLRVPLKLGANSFVLVLV